MTARYMNLHFTYLLTYFTYLPTYLLTYLLTTTEPARGSSEQVTYWLW